MCGVFCGLRLDVGGASWAARILAAALILALVPTTPTAGWLLCADGTLEMSCFGWQRCVNCGGAWSVVEGAGGGMAVARVWKGVCIVVCGVVWCQDCMYFLCVCVCCWSEGVVSFGVGVCCDCGSRSGAGAGSVTVVSVARGALRSWRTCGAACVMCC